LTDRLDYLSAMTNNWAYCLAVEKLLAVAIPDRAEYLRIIVGELQRIASHCVFLGPMGSISELSRRFWSLSAANGKDPRSFREICGARLTYNYIRIGGVMADAPMVGKPRSAVCQGNVRTCG